MAIPSQKLISALRTTAARVEAGARYEWGHMAHCNCGHLVQTITEKTGAELSQDVNHTLDEWTEHARDICALTGESVEGMFNALLKYGFNRQDVQHLEWLSDKRVLRRVGEGVYLERNKRDHLILYLRTMAEMLEEDLAGTLISGVSNRSHPRRSHRNNLHLAEQP